MHCMVLVLVEKDVEDPVGDAYQRVEQFIELVSDSLSVGQCECTQSAAWEYGDAVAAATHGDYMALRRRWRKRRRKLGVEERLTFPTQEEYLRPYEETARREAEQHPQWGQPDPACEQCHGSGRADSQFSDVSCGKFDWAWFGGRFTGALDPGYDPTRDPRNMDPCDTCAVRETSRMEPLGEACPECHGTGVGLRFVYLWEPFEGDVKPVAEVLERFPHEVPGAAVITPDGKYYDGAWPRGSRRARAAWRQEKAALLKRYREAVVVVMDCDT